MAEAVTAEPTKAPSKDAVRRTAEGAARVYLVSGKKKRTLRECIGYVRSEEDGVSFESVINYLAGVGARAMLTDTDLAFDLLEKAQSCLYDVGECSHYDLSDEAPRRVENGTCLEADNLQVEIKKFLEGAK